LIVLMAGIADDVPETSNQTLKNVLERGRAMTKTIISYDGTDNDRDALALGKALESVSDLALAYVSHTGGNTREAAHAVELLREGADAVGQNEVDQHVELNASTPDGLSHLAQREGADVVVFGSDYRTADGSINPGTSARRLLDGSQFAVAVAPANLRSRSEYSIRTVGVLSEAGDEAPAETARRLAAALGATVTEPGHGPVDLLIVGSREGTPDGKVRLSATADYAIETASSAVLAVPRGKAVAFGAAVAAAQA
jgi:nucleotide-binding universal stress UspA family protein